LPIYYFYDNVQGMREWVIENVESLKNLRSLNHSKGIMKRFSGGLSWIGYKIMGIRGMLFMTG
jgi:hypothetical protein